MSIYIYSRVSEDMPSDAYLGVNSPLTDPPGPPRKLSTNINISDYHARDKIPLYVRRPWKGHCKICCKTHMDR